MLSHLRRLCPADALRAVRTGFHHEPLCGPIGDICHRHRLDKIIEASCMRDAHLFAQATACPNQRWTWRPFGRLPTFLSSFGHDLYRNGFRPFPNIERFSMTSRRPPSPGLASKRSGPTRLNEIDILAGTLSFAWRWLVSDRGRRINDENAVCSAGEEVLSPLYHKRPFARNSAVIGRAADNCLSFRAIIPESRASPRSRWILLRSPGNSMKFGGTVGR